jgi:trk system potassium uptake protein
VKFRAVFYSLGRLMQMLALVLLVPTGIALWQQRGGGDMWSPEISSFTLTILVSLLLGTILQGVFRAGRFDQGIKEGFAIVTLGWVMLALLGSIPFTVHFLRMGMSPLVAFTDAYFEIMSGFSTTGSTILTDIENLPRGLLFWRSMTHWLGGMGIVTLVLAIFPAMGVGGYQMFRGEVPGPTADRLRPRLAETAKILWGVYVLLTGVETLLLMFGGMDLYDALCHSFATLATGGFSTRNASVGAYNSAYIDYVITFFMFMAGTNFLIHYRLLFRGDWLSLRRNREFHFYFGTVALAITFATLLLWMGGLPGSEEVATHFNNEPRSETELVAHLESESAKVATFPGAFRYASFQVLAIVTTTGFGTADFDVWPRALGLLFVVLMFWGGCAGSTGGGMKMIRVMVTFKAAWREVKKVVRPRLISPLKVRRTPMGEDRVANIVGFFVLFVGLFVVCSVIMSFFVHDMTTAVSAVAASIGNIGPGLSGVGSTQTYTWIPIPGKWLLVLCMLLGRLEIFTVLVVMRPGFWRK